MENNLGNQRTVNAYLVDIAEKLATGHAAVMVGAGFSKNAIEKFPLWNELGLEFYKKINAGKEPSAEERFLNPLKLASEFDALFRKNELNNFLKKSIPDKEHAPSKLHVELLKLPWVDVFTTNYDTLLERATKQIINRRFDIVTNERQLPFSQSPRIIKLHGCFDNDTDIIITEDDYLQYPKKHATFVNTVQQSLIENALCLIGFSGDDPNFLNWINWIISNLGKDAAPQIYLIELFGITEAKRKLLEKRNITVLELKNHFGSSGSTSFSLLEEFLDFLSKSIKDRCLEDWPNNVSGVMNIRITKAENNIHNWSKERKEYPQWVVLPYSNRKELRRLSDNAVRDSSAIRSLNFPQNIHFLFELDWRFTKCLYVIWNDSIPDYEAILNQINPFPELLVVPTQYIPTTTPQEDWKEISFQWVELHFSLMRLFRQEGFWDKWDEIDEKIQKIHPQLLPEQIARWHYEKALKLIFCFDFKQALQQIQQWPSNFTLPFWEAKRAALLAELNQHQEAREIVAKALQKVREKLNLTSNTSDYELVSQEVHIMKLHRDIYSMQSFQSFESLKKQQESEERREFEERRKQTSNVIDVYHELELFEMNLKHKYSGESNQTKTYSFDLGRIHRTNHWGPNEDVIEAYAFMLFCEEIGTPIFYKIPSQGAIERIGKYSPMWATILLIRSGITERKSFDTLFSRESISKLTQKQVDENIDIYLRILNEVLVVVSTEERNAENIYTRAAKVLPEIISRLCAKCSISKLDQIMEFLYRVLDQNREWDFNQIPELLERTIKAYNSDQLFERLLQFIKFPTHNKHFDPMWYCYFSLNNLDKKQIDRTSINVENLLEQLKNEDSDLRNYAFVRLYCLHKCNALLLAEVKSFADNLWSITDTVGLPSQNLFLSTSILAYIPKPNHIEPYSIVKKHILNKCVPTELIKPNDTNAIDYRVSDAPFEYIFGGSKRWHINNGIEWSKDEIKVLIDQFWNWWHLGKENLRNDQIELFNKKASDPFKKHFTQLVNILTEIIFPLYSGLIDKESQEKLKQLMDEMEAYQLPCDTARVASLILFKDDIKNVASKIKRNSILSDNDTIFDTYKAIYTWLKYSQDQLIDPIPEGLLQRLIECLKWRYQPGVFYTLQSLRYIIDEIPNSLNETDLLDILTSLDVLQIETTPSTEESIFKKFEVRLDVRRYAAQLAFSLFQYYQSLGAEVPESIVAWKTICENPEEFVEIRKAWYE